jgi:hypothetical protein
MESINPLMKPLASPKRPLAPLTFLFGFEIGSAE